MFNAISIATYPPEFGAKKKNPAAINNRKKRQERRATFPVTGFQTLKDASQFQATQQGNGFAANIFKIPKAMFAIGKGLLQFFVIPTKHTSGRKISGQDATWVDPDNKA